MSRRTPEPVKTACYLVLVPDVRGTGSGEYVRKVRIARATANKPKLGKGEVAFRLALTLDETALMESIPTINLTVGNLSAPGAGVSEINGVWVKP